MASCGPCSTWDIRCSQCRRYQEELKKTYRERPWRCGRKFESWDSEESEEQEFTEEQWKQTEAHKLLLSDFVAIAKQLSTS